MLKNLIKSHADKVRFAIVGALNTVIDVSILFILVGIGLPVSISNLVSTSIALLFSFFANKKFTFRAEKTAGKNFALFILITLFGLWVIQTVIIEVIRVFMQPLNLDARLVLLIGKAIATVASLTWNYILYKKYVFKK